MPDPASPLTLTRTGPTTGPLTLTDESALLKYQVKAGTTGPVRTALGTPFGRTKRPDMPASRGSQHTESGISAHSEALAEALADALVGGSGPGEWLVLAPPSKAHELRTALAELIDQAAEFATLVDLTHGRALVRLTGADSAALLAKVCAVDLADVVTPNGAAFRSSVARVVTDLVRDDLADGTPSYLLHCERSSGQYLAGALLDAGAEFGVVVGAEVGTP